MIFLVFFFQDGRIHTGDHLFQINHVYVRGMSAEQVAGILRQCSQEVRLVVARSVREGPPTTTSGTSNSPSLSKRSSLTSENLSRTRHPSSSMMVETDGMINNLQKKIFLRTERLLESNHNLEKILDHLLEQVCLRFFSFFFTDLIQFNSIRFDTRKENDVNYFY